MKSFPSVALFAAAFLACGPAFAADGPRVAAFETGFVDGADPDDPDSPRFGIEERLSHHATPGFAVAIIDNEEVVWTGGYGRKRAGVEEAVGPDTAFSVGSVSKMVNAALILRLAAEGAVDLDTDVNEYLTSWKVPENRHTRKKKVTLRAILSHTAGFNVHGFPDFQPGAALPTAIDTLEGRRPAKNRPVRVTFAPGDRMDYSGGGITVSQVLVEDVTGLTYEEAARKYVFEPLGMVRSTFQNPLPAGHGDIAAAHDQQGRPAALPRGWEAMPEMAASGLWTSANDLAIFVKTLIKSARGTDDFLPQPLAEDMMTRVQNSWHGLGPRLNGEGPTRVFHHGGANDSYRAWIEGNLTTGDGAVFLTNSAGGHFVVREARRSVGEAFDWATSIEDGYEGPES